MNLCGEKKTAKAQRAQRFHGAEITIFLVNLVNLADFVRTPISHKFSLPEKEISHKVHQASCHCSS